MRVPEPVRALVRALGELPPVRFLGRLVREISDDDVLGLAAQCAFAWAFALFPFLIFLVSLTAYMPWSAGGKPEIPPEIEGQLPVDVHRIVEGRLTEVARGDRAGLLTVSFLLTVWSASTGAATMVYAVNRAYDVKEFRPFWKRRLIGVVLIFTGALLVFVPALYGTLGGIAAGLLDRANLGALAIVVDWFRWPVILAGAIAWLMLLYNLAPEDRSHWRLLSPGVIFSVFGILAANRGLSLYVENTSSLGVTYGALGGFVVLLLWLYVSSAVLLIGAEINALTESDRKGRRAEWALREKRAPADQPRSKAGPRRRTEDAV